VVSDDAACRAVSVPAHADAAGHRRLAAVALVAAVAGQSFLIGTPPGLFPVWITGPLGGRADTIGRPELLTLVLLMWLAYAVVILASRRLRPVLALSVLAALHLTFLLAPPLLPWPRCDWRTPSVGGRPS
jgi:hypothetical protein